MIKLLDLDARISPAHRATMSKRIKERGKCSWLHHSKDLWQQDRQVKFNPQNSHGKRKEMIPTRCPLIQTQNKSLKKEKNINLKMLWKYQSAKSSKKD